MTYAFVEITEYVVDEDEPTPVHESLMRAWFA